MAIVEIKKRKIRGPKSEPSFVEVRNKVFRPEAGERIDFGLVRFRFNAGEVKRSADFGSPVIARPLGNSVSGKGRQLLFRLSGFPQDIPDRRHTYVCEARYRGGSDCLMLERVKEEKGLDKSKIPFLATSVPIPTSPDVTDHRYAITQVRASDLSGYLVLRDRR